MKKSKLLICLILSIVSVATWSCTRHDDDDDDNSSNHITITSLSGTTWTYGYDNHTALVEFSQSTFSITEDDGEYMSGSYNYDGETFTCTFIYDYDDRETYKLYCLTKANSPSSLQGTVWKFEEIYDERGEIYTYIIYLYENTFTLIDDKYGDEERGYYAYDGNTITATCDGETLYLTCGKVLYEMARNKTNIW